MGDGNGPIDSVEELARRARKLIEESPSRDPLRSRHLHRAVRSQLTAAETAAFGVVEPPAPVAAAAAADVLHDAETALAKVDAGNASNVTDREFASLEAIVLLEGRPAMRYRDGRVEMPVGDDNERWMTFVATARSKINAASAKVGQVALALPDGSAHPLGTAWRAGDDLVVTNRHVAAELAGGTAAAPHTWTLANDRRGVVLFNATDGATDARRFGIAELAYCADEPEIDFAVFRLDAGNTPLPAPLTLDWRIQSLGANAAGAFSFKGREIYIVGHPYRPFSSDAVVTVFQRADGLKRCSPGKVTLVRDADLSFEHDCSTLGGNSGSCVLSVAEHKVVGLHYAGADVDPISGMGRANLALALSRLGTHRAAQILKDGRVV